MSWVAGSDRLALSARPRSFTCWSARSVSRSAAGGGRVTPALKEFRRGKVGFFSNWFFILFSV